MAQFYLKAEEGRDKVLRVREYVRLENGYDGLSSAQTREDLAKEYGEFTAKLEAYGEDKAQAEARENGTFCFPDKPRPTDVVEQEIESTEKKLAALKGELSESVAAYDVKVANKAARSEKKSGKVKKKVEDPKSEENEDEK